MNGIVHEHETDASLGKLIGFLPTMANDFGAIGVNDDGINVAKDGLIVRPTIDDSGMNVEATLLVEGFGKELAASVEFMFTRLVGPLACEKKNIGGLSTCIRKPKGNRPEYEQ
ncbi:unnamed protein product [marine sediment metagenome]|uniref:Uncharacterized protein n=1 Tax=marine sediment metagenome TaxID=412755 RepID=X0UC14_9ZZZZ